jgi:predicted dehydrogenase
MTMLSRQGEKSSSHQYQNVMKEKQANNKYSRKEFLKTAGIGMAGLTLGMSAKSYGNIIGANERVRFGIVGLHGRGQAHIDAVHQLPNCTIAYLCDVDSKILKERTGQAQKLTGSSIKTEKDVRELVEKSDIDAISIATPGHWHTPMAILGVNAGKHVYVEKPFSHNPQEGEWLVAAQKKYPKLVMQMGDQQRSAQTSIEAVELIKGGLIGRAYYGKAWYTNKRGTIGTGRPVPVPASLDWDLWQGPAPRKQYKDNIVPYNWHWFWNWGTGELGNNAIHEVDFCRWALDVQYPVKASSSGGRYQFRDDDWQFYDTQLASYEYGGDDNKLINWEGLSCNSYPFFNRDRGSLIRGSKGEMIVDRSGYVAYNMDNKVIKERKEVGKTATSTSNIVGGGNLTVKHFHNFAESIRGREKPHAPMSEAHKSVLLCHLGNISQKTGRTLEINPDNGRIEKDPDAMKMWTREYEPGWEPKV